MSVKVGVLGEALIDLITQKQHFYRACLGGSSFNFALAMAKQKQKTAFLTPLSYDDFGQQLAQNLDQFGVIYPLRSHFPTSLAMVNLDSQGGASYSFYREGVADRDYTVEHIISNLHQDMSVLHTGGLALCFEDRDKLEAIFTHLRQRNIMISIDVNVRPKSQKNLTTYYETIRHLIRYADIIKLSQEDMDNIYRHSAINCDYDEIAHQLLEQSACLVALTFGSKGAKLFTQTQKASCSGFHCDEIVDSIGSGDVFIASLIAWLLQESRTNLSTQSIQNLNKESLADGVRYACIAATINLMRVGCQPPSIDEVYAQLDFFSQN